MNVAALGFEPGKAEPADLQSPEGRPAPRLRPATLATGQIKSKDAAADWALAQLPPEHRAVLEHARQLYLNCPYSEESWSDALQAQVRPHVDRVLAEIDRLLTGTPRM